MGFFSQHSESPKNYQSDLNNETVTENSSFLINYSQREPIVGQAIFPFQAKYTRQNKRIQKGAGRNAAASQEQTIPLRTGHQGNWKVSECFWAIGKLSFI